MRCPSPGLPIQLFAIDAGNGYSTKTLLNIGLEHVRELVRECSCWLSAPVSHLFECRRNVRGALCLVPREIREGW
jgi:hypothetical protein